MFLLATAAALQDVLGLDATTHYIMLVHVREPCGDLKHCALLEQHRIFRVLRVRKKS